MFAKKKPLPQRRKPATSPDRSSSVFSYYSNRSAQTPGSKGQGRKVSEAVAQRRSAMQHRLRRTLWWSAAIVVVAALLFNLSLGATPKVVIDGNSVLLHSRATYNTAAKNVLGASITSKTKLSINTQKLSAQLSKQFPELASAEVSIPFIGTHATVVLRPAAPRIILITKDGQAYALDKDGRVLAAAASLPSSLGLPVVQDQSGLGIKLGQIALPSSNIDFITEVTGQLKAAHLALSSMTILAGTNQLDVRLNGEPYTVKFNLMGNARVEAGSFLAVKQRLDGEHKKPGSYIDVRVDNRAYYK